MFFLWQIRFVLLNIRLQTVQGLAIFKWPVCNKRLFYTVLSEKGHALMMYIYYLSGE